MQISCAPGASDFDLVPISVLISQVTANCAIKTVSIFGEMSVSCWLMVGFHSATSHATNNHRMNVSLMIFIIRVVVNSNSILFPGTFWYWLSARKNMKSLKKQESNVVQNCECLVIK
jgi:hypothetical protein